jgi:hypothetical protein
MRHVVLSEDLQHGTSWSDQSHEMDGDWHVQKLVKASPDVIGDLHEAPIANDMGDPKYVIPAMLGATQVLYGGTPIYRQAPEAVSVSAPDQADGGRLTSNADARLNR